MNMYRLPLHRSPPLLTRFKYRHPGPIVPSNRHTEYISLVTLLYTCISIAMVF
eukprot:c35234_g1_i1 orf=86-244(+)